MSRRWRLFRVSEDAMESVFTVMRVAVNGQYVVLPHFRHEDLPDDAKLARVGHDPWSKCFTLAFEHPLFDEVPDGGMPPENHIWLLNVKMLRCDTPDSSSLIVPILSQAAFRGSGLRDMLTGLLQKIGVSYAGTDFVQRRWSFSDLATDLAAEIEKLLNAGEKT